MLLNKRPGFAACSFAAALFAAAACAASCDPAERVSGEADRESINLTIYNGGNSLVHDRRRVSLAAGENGVAWRDVSGQMDATSAILSDLTLPGGAQIVEQNFDYDLLEPSTLLEKYVGHDVTIVHDRPAAGEPARETAKLLANNEGLVLQYRDRIETGLVDCHIVFPSIPANLRDRPTLVLDVFSQKAATQSLDLAYLTGGLGWRADYVGVVSADERHMAASGLVTLTNTTGTTYVNARLQLVAGNVNFTEPSGERESPVTFAPAAPTPPGFSHENYFEYHLYTLGRPTTVANAQTKQVSLLHVKRVPIRKTLELRGSSSYYSNRDADLGEKLKVGVFITFTNEGGDLGIPLPGGTFRLYKNDAHGTSQFLGSDAIDHTPRGQDVRLHVGDSFDVTANKKQTDFKGIGGCTYESAYSLKLSNAKDEAQDVLVVEPIPGTWSILAENFKHRKTSSSTASWSLRVPARSSTTLGYSARVSLCI